MDSLIDEITQRFSNFPNFSCFSVTWQFSTQIWYKMIKLLRNLPLKLLTAFINPATKIPAFYFVRGASVALANIRWKYSVLRMKVNISIGISETNSLGSPCVRLFPVFRPLTPLKPVILRDSARGLPSNRWNVFTLTKCEHFSVRSAIINPFGGVRAGNYEKFQTGNSIYISRFEINLID